MSLAGSAIVNGAWVRGTQAIGWGESDQGSGLRFTRLKLDGAIPGGGLIDWRGSCDLGATGPSGEFARRFNPCPTGGPYWRSYALNTASLSDGAHSLAVCAQDYGQSQSGGESCAARTIHTDNTAPGKPAGLQVTSSNPARYLDRFGARFSLPFNAGSPIRKVRYYVTDEAGKVVVPEKTIAATNPTSLSGLEGPAKPGAYTLHVALEDEVGWVGAASSAPIPHDTIPPAAPQGLHVIGTTTHRVPKFDVQWSNVTDNGSPITVAHYEVIDSAGHVVSPTQTVSAGNIEAIKGIATPADAGDYRARVWLADAEGNVGAASTVALPRDTIPPAAPQSLHVVGTTAHRVPKFDVRWSDVPDNGSPITVARYQLIDSAGHAVTPTQTATAEGIEAIKGIATPAAAGDYRVRVWLADEEGNVGAASTVAVPRDTTPPAAPQQVSVAAPAQSRAERGLDVRWRNLADDGSPIAAAHYRVLDGGGKQVVPPTTVSGANVESIADLDTPRDRGAYTLVLWLSDAEGNVGAPVRVPLSYECVRSDKGGGSTLTAGLGKRGRPALTVRQGEGAVLRGRLAGGARRRGRRARLRVQPGRDRQPSAASSVWRSRTARAATGSRSAAAPLGKSRWPTAPGQREATASATLRVRVRPTFKLKKKVVHNGHAAIFRGRIPGPDNGSVVVVLQVKSGKGWRVFRRYRTRAGGRFLLRYRFTRTRRPVIYLMRAQVRRQGGYPYLQGNSRRLRLTVRP